jgi:hypothetical protein
LRIALYWLFVGDENGQIKSWFNVSRCPLEASR